MCLVCISKYKYKNLQGFCSVGVFLGTIFWIDAGMSDEKLFSKRVVEKFLFINDRTSLYIAT